MIMSFYLKENNQELDYVTKNLFLRKDIELMDDKSCSIEDIKKIEAKEKKCFLMIINLSMVENLSIGKENQLALFISKIHNFPVIAIIDRTNFPLAKELSEASIVTLSKEEFREFFSLNNKINNHDIYYYINELSKLMETSSELKIRNAFRELIRHILEKNFLVWGEML
jgi:hypothetical protein